MKSRELFLKYSKVLFGSSMTTYLTLFAPSHLAKKHTVSSANDDTKQDQDKKGLAVVYTWLPDKERQQIGHQAVLIKGGQNDQPFYISFYPAEPATKYVNFLPFKFLSLGGHFSCGMHEDIENEGRKPDMVTVVPHLHYDEMKKLHDQMHEDVKDHKHGYQFFPNVPRIHNLIAYANHYHPSVSPFAHEPISEIPLDHDHPKVPAVKKDNCTSVIRRLLEAGGYPKEGFPNLLPWGNSPIGQHLSLEYIGAKKINETEKEALIEEALKAEHKSGTHPHHNRKPVLG
ncbi:hypothetical protein [Aquicella lusitana]|nr:hypothetical protein [Aquicella lusitana]